MTDVNALAYLDAALDRAHAANVRAQVIVAPVELKRSYENTFRGIRLFRTSWPVTEIWPLSRYEYAGIRLIFSKRARRVEVF